MENTSIPFNRTSSIGREHEYLLQSLESGHMSASGPFSRRVSSLLQGTLGSADVLLTTSCTSALEMSALLLDLQPGDTATASTIPSFPVLWLSSERVPESSSPILNR